MARQSETIALMRAGQGAGKALMRSWIAETKLHGRRLNEGQKDLYVCSKGRLPKSRLDYWQAKLEGNVDRDRKELERLGWRMLVTWQCELVDADALAARLKDFVGRA